VSLTGDRLATGKSPQPAGWKACATAQFMAAEKVCSTSTFRYSHAMNRLTRQEQMVLCIVLGLLLTGWAVKACRTAHPPAGAIPGEVPSQSSAEPAKD